MTETARGADAETRYDVIEVDSTLVAMISDVANDRAWIQSTVVMPVRP